LAALDPKQKNEGVAFRPQRSLSASGPWEDVPNIRTTAFPYASDSYLDKKVRPDPATYIITDLQEQTAYANGTLPYQPLHYRVVQQHATRNPTQPYGKDITISGSEQVSNVVSPAKPAIEVFSRRPGPSKKSFADEAEWGTDASFSEVYVSAPSGADDILLSAALCQPDQGYRYYNTHYTVKSHRGTWHFFDTPPPFPRNPQEKRNPLYWLRIPLDLAGGKLTISAEAPGASATREITLTLDPALVASRQKLLADLQKNRDDPRQAQDRKTELDRRQAEIKDLELKTIADPTTIKESWPAFNWGPVAWSLETARFNLKVTTECAWPSIDLDKELVFAETAWEWAKLPELRMQKISLLRKEQATREKHLMNLEDIHKKWMALAGRFKSDEGTKQLKSFEKFLEDSRLRAVDDDERRFSSEYQRLGWAALMAGNAGVHEQAVEGIRQVIRKRGPYPNCLTPLSNMGDDIVTVSGDRQAAVKAVMEGRQWQLLGREGAAREKEQRMYESLTKPSWWPQ
jgi:hypothetical protein